jgi:GNAT superfamily N-acetyltransferase
VPILPSPAARYRVPVHLRTATPDEAPAILALRTAAERWLADRGIEQWHPGEITLAGVTSQARAGEWHLASDNGVACATLRLLWSDPLWTGIGTQRPAVYVHGLVIDRAYAGQGLGARLLDWAADQGRRAGAEVLRLDCVEINPALRSYYARLGFRQVGRRDFDGPWHSAALLERDIAIDLKSG